MIENIDSRSKTILSWMSIRLHQRSTLIGSLKPDANDNSQRLFIALGYWDLLKISATDKYVAICEGSRKDDIRDACFSLCLPLRFWLLESRLTEKTTSEFLQQTDKFPLLSIVFIKLREDKIYLDGEIMVRIRGSLQQICSSVESHMSEMAVHVVVHMGREEVVLLVAHADFSKVKMMVNTIRDKYCLQTFTIPCVSWPALEKPSTQWESMFLGTERIIYPRVAFAVVPGNMSLVRTRCEMLFPQAKIAAQFGKKDISLTFPNGIKSSVFLRSMFANENCGISEQTFLKQMIVETETEIAFGDSDLFDKIPQQRATMSNACVQNMFNVLAQQSKIIETNHAKKGSVIEHADYCRAIRTYELLKTLLQDDRNWSPFIPIVAALNKLPDILMSQKSYILQPYGGDITWILLDNLIQFRLSQCRTLRTNAEVGLLHRGGILRLLLFWENLARLMLLALIDRMPNDRCKDIAVLILISDRPRVSVLPLKNLFLIHIPSVRLFDVRSLYFILLHEVAEGLLGANNIKMEDFSPFNGRTYGEKIVRLLAKRYENKSVPDKEKEERKRVMEKTLEKIRFDAVADVVAARNPFIGENSESLSRLAWYASMRDIDMKYDIKDKSSYSSKHLEGAAQFFWRRVLARLLSDTRRPTGVWIKEAIAHEWEMFCMFAESCGRFKNIKMVSVRKYFISEQANNAMDEEGIKMAYDKFSGLGLTTRSRVMPTKYTLIGNEMHKIIFNKEACDFSHDETIQCMYSMQELVGKTPLAELYGFC